METYKDKGYWLIYVYRINDADHEGYLKIGETTFQYDAPPEEAIKIQPDASCLNKAAKKRIDEQTITASIRYDLLHTEVALRYNKEGKIEDFRDTLVHNLLTRSKVEKIKNRDDDKNGKEWFKLDLKTAIRAIERAKENLTSLSSDEITHDENPIILRPEQRDAIDKTKARFKKGDNMLWYAKMRFGKTVCALEVIKEIGFNKTLILTHRPVVDNGWYDDFNTIFNDTKAFTYGSKNHGEEFYNLIKLNQKGQNIVYFASMQDLRGSETVGGKFDKNDEIFSTHWDLLIIDEAHEGTQTKLGQEVKAEIVKDGTKTLELSGTPFNLFEKFDEESIFVWDYVMEQKAKEDWDRYHFGDHNPYADLPRMNIYTYDLGELLDDYADDIAFNFHEFFLVNEDGSFKHKNDILAFLNLLTKEDKDSKYPFSNEKFRDIFRHTLWMVPGVKEAKALSSMLKEHRVFQNFKIVNVAGDGDEEEENRNALEKVKKAIGDDPDETYTITLSCGRLTMGVTIPAWTGVFMLAGGFNTAAATYMQTIFRIQSPATINGRVKEECYVFDFAPDRTLQVIADVAQVSTKAGSTTDVEREKLGEFINFCPVISIEGSKMEPQSTEKMIQTLKRVHVEAVVRSGFESERLYNNELLMLSDLDLKKFANLKGIIGSTPAMGKTANIDVNRQGLTNEEYEELQDLEKRNKKKKGNDEPKTLSEEEVKRLEELKEKRKIKRDAISILRGISIRMPLLIYGADIDQNDEAKRLTIDNFTELVDDQSWEEFMPKGVTKETFDDFKQYYDPEIFSAAGRRIREMTRNADKLTIEERIARIVDIFSFFRNPDKETVLTPWRVVNMHMGDTLGGYNFFDEEYENRLEEPRYIEHEEITEEVFAPDTHLLEINSKTGFYPLYLTYTLYRKRLEESATKPETLEEHLKIWDKVVRKNIFVICKTEMAKKITKRTLVGYRDAKVNSHYFEDLINQIKNKPDNFLKKVVKGNTYWKTNNDDNMKFNAVVGNPPYQEAKERTSDLPVYNYFMDISFKLSDRVTLITPGRYLFNAGKTPSDWNNKILNDEHFKVVCYKPKSSDIFPNVDIKGGVAVMYRDANENFGKIGMYSQYDEITSILNKVRTADFAYFNELIYSPESYRFSKLFHQKHPEIAAALGAGHLFDLTTNVFDKIPEYFFEDKPNDGCDYIQIYGRMKGGRVLKWIKREYIEPHDNLDFYKVFVPKANGTGAIGEILSTPVIGQPVIGQPVIGHTETFISIGKFETEFEVKACLKYIKTKFARTLLGSLKVTQDNKKNSWANVPMQDFTPQSDIDWSQSVADIDKQLYKKYGLNEEEQQFIETMIKPM